MHDRDQLFDDGANRNQRTGTQIERTPVDVRALSSGKKSLLSRHPHKSSLLAIVRWTTAERPLPAKTK